VRFANTAVLVGAFVIGIGGAYALGRRTSTRDDVAKVKLKRFDEYCLKTKSALKQIADWADGQDIAERKTASSTFEIYFVKEDKQAIRLCSDESKWPLIDPEDRAVFCSDNMKQDPIANSHACMKELATQSLTLLDQ
jgi:hypothetical protein